MTLSRVWCAWFSRKDVIYPAKWSNSLAGKVAESWQSHSRCILHTQEQMLATFHESIYRVSLQKNRPPKGKEYHDCSWRS